MQFRCIFKEMKILSLKPGHDGSVALIDNEKLLLSFEAEKNSYPRYESLSAEVILDAMGYVDDIPDVFAISGWAKESEDRSYRGDIGAGYEYQPTKSKIMHTLQAFGKSATYFSSSHERSHIMCSYGLSPLEQGCPCYLLVWEGILGDFYEIDSNVKIKHLGRVIEQPGAKYSAFYWVANGFKGHAMDFSHSSAGKLMALAAFSSRGSLTKDEVDLIDFILDYPRNTWELTVDEVSWSPYANIGTTDPAFKELAGKASDKIFERFYSFAKQRLTKKLPLLISGGCGLNCEWNTKWKNSGLFASVFIPPCTNDTGAAIGTAIDAQFNLTGSAKLSWSVYTGQDFQSDLSEVEDYIVFPLDYRRLAEYLIKEYVIAWVQGRCEIGPRALGNRSILASPFSSLTRDRLNTIKRREGYRPIAPICLEEDVSSYFDWLQPSPFMLFFQNVKLPNLNAITHVDGTARVQTVNSTQNEKTYKLLTAFKALSGVGVLCNTSLNFSGTGFINSLSDLVKFSNMKNLDGFVVGDSIYIKEKVASNF